MGKVYEKITTSNIPNGADIACTVATDHLIVASVSNWGGYALAASLGVVYHEAFPTHFGTLENALARCLPSSDMETHICQRMVEAGARDGISGKNDLFVDGMPLQASIDVIEEIQDIINKNWSSS